MKRILTLFFVALAINFSYGQSVTDMLKWLNKNTKKAENVSGSGSVYGGTLEFTKENIRAYTKENQIIIGWNKINEIIVTTYSEKNKHISIDMDDNTHIDFDCEKCVETAQKIAYVSDAFGGKAQLFTRDMSKLTSEDIFGK